jgi:hypothetical protein
MTGPIEERSYRWARRYVFAITVTAIILIPVLSFLV